MTHGSINCRYTWTEFLALKKSWHHLQIKSIPRGTWRHSSGTGEVIQANLVETCNRIYFGVGNASRHSTAKSSTCRLSSFVWKQYSSEAPPRPKRLPGRAFRDVLPLMCLWFVRSGGSAWSLSPSLSGREKSCLPTESGKRRMKICDRNEGEKRCSWIKRTTLLYEKAVHSGLCEAFRLRTLHSMIDNSYCAHAVG